MSTAVRTVQSMSNHEDLEAWVRGLFVSSNPTDAVNVNEIESLSDNCSGGGIGEAILELMDNTEPIVHSICGRDRRLSIR